MRAVVGRAYDGSVAVQNLVDVYHDAVGLEQLAAKVTRPFAGLKVACYYGCLLTRPPKVTLAEDPSTPPTWTRSPRPWAEAHRLELQDRLLRRLAGAHRQAIVDDFVARIVTDARTCGAQAIVVACPLCQVNLDGRQTEIARARGDWQGVPVVFLSQLVGRALGMDERPSGSEAPRRRHGGHGLAATAVHPRPPGPSGHHLPDLGEGEPCEGAPRGAPSAYATPVRGARRECAAPTAARVAARGWDGAGNAARAESRRGGDGARRMP